MPTVASPRPLPADVMVPALAALSRYVSPPTAQSVLTLARRRIAGSGPRLDRAQLREILGPIERGLRLFLADPSQAEACRRELEALAGATQEPARPSAAQEPARAALIVLAMRAEDDIARARREARDFAASHGFSVVGQTRLTTAVSELARNIIQYAGSGEIELRAATSPPGLEVAARDRGPGIPNLEKILSGDYRSKLGMGLGLRGVKKLADAFDVTTAPGKGTTVSFRMKTV